LGTMLTRETRLSTCAAWRVATSEFGLTRSSIHGPAHWSRVAVNGLVVGRRSGADLTVVLMFAWLHDCRRTDDGADVDHGERAAALIRECHEAGTFVLTRTQLDLLLASVLHHSEGGRVANRTVGTCWDADRLDLARPGIEATVEPAFLSTAAARSSGVILAAARRARSGMQLERGDGYSQLLRRAARVAFGGGVEASSGRSGL